MNVIKIKDLLNSQEFLAYLIGLVLSTLLIGYAPSSIALGFFLFFSFRYSFLQKKKLKTDFYLLIPMLLYVLFVLTFIWSVNQGQTKTGLERTIALLVVPMAFNVMPKVSFENYKRILNVFTFSNLLFGLVFLINAFYTFYRTNSISAFTYHELVSLLDLNAIYVSVIFSVSLFYLLTKARKTKWDLLMIVFFLILLLLLSSKTVMFVLLIGIFIYLFCYGIKISKTKTLLALIGLGLLIGIGSISLKQRVLYEKDSNLIEILDKEQFGQIYPWTGSSIRLLQLRILKEQLEEESIFWKGFGLFASRDNLKKRHIKFDTYPTFHDYNYHNQYAQIFSETGIFGICLLIMMLLIPLYKVLKSKNFLFIMFYILVGSVFFTESLLWRQQGLFLFVILYCLTIRTSFEKKSH
jgi:O-antigen ligase